MSCCSGRRLGTAPLAPPQGWGVTIPGVIDIHGEPVVEASPAKTGIVKALDDALGYVKDNPLVVALAGAAVYAVAVGAAARKVRRRRR